MSAALRWYLDISSSPGRLVTGLTNAAAVNLQSVFQGSKLALRVYPVMPTGRVTGQLFSKVLSGSMDLRIGIGPRAGAESLYAYQYTWAQQLSNDSDGESGYWYATLNLNTNELNTAIGSNDSLSTWLEIAIGEGGDWRAVYQAQLTVLARVMDLGGSAALPSAAAEYYTKDELRALFVPWDSRLIAGNAGKTITLVSPDASQVRELGVANTGAPIDNLGNSGLVMS